jgi:hypothetical protein
MKSRIPTILARKPTNPTKTLISPAIQVKRERLDLAEDSRK